MKSASMSVKRLGLRLVSWVVSRSLPPPPSPFSPSLPPSLRPCLPPPLCPVNGACLVLPLPPPPCGHIIIHSVT